MTVATRFYFCLVVLLSFRSAVAESSQPPEWKEEAVELVEQIRQGDAGKVVEPQMRLLEIAPLNPPESLESFLATLEPTEGALSEKAKGRLEKVHTAVVEQAAQKLFEPSRFSFSEQAVPLDDVLEHLEKQTGNRLMDYRGHVGQERTPRTLSLNLKDKQFWPAVDEILDQAALGPYEFSSDEGLGLVELQRGSTTRKSRGSYAGPFRIEAAELTTRRSMITPAENRLHVKLHVSWEPRLGPLSITQKVADVSATDDRGEELPVATPEAEFEIDLQPNSYATEILLPFELPTREAKRLKTLTGKLTVLAPARRVEFRFEKLKEAVGTEQAADGVVVKLSRIVPLDGLVEIHMRLQLKGEAGGLDAHGDWVFGNLALLENQAGETIENAGFETTMRNDEEIGFAYLFEIPADEISEGLENYTWIYRTPAAIQAKTIEYELRDLPLP